jgi:type VI secretion system secreted protein Hcp
MAVQMILHLDGIKGESKKDGNEAEIDITSWAFGMSQSGTWHTGGGGGGGIVNMQDITLTKNIDAASADLMSYCCKGDHIPAGSLTVYKVGGSNLDYYKIDLEKVIISSVQTTGTGNGDAVTETVTLNFAVIKIKYKEQGDDGSAKAEYEMGFNVETNVAV